MVELEVSDLQWINGPDDDPKDQCAHGRVAVSVDGVELASVSEGLWTVSAVALYLLRSLEHDHCQASSVAEGSQLFPCCGFSVWQQDGRFPVVIIGCPDGVDIWIRLEDGQVILQRDELSMAVPAEGWKATVLGFVAAVENFYEQASPKETPADPEDRAGWQAFWDEWRQRKAAATESS